MWWLSVFVGFCVTFGCMSASDTDSDWWKHTIVYQVYPRSFQDSDGDGVGDIPGIQSRLDHFEYLGVETIWLSPVYKSPFKDFGYDVADHKDIDPIFGTLQDLDNLLKELHRRGMKLIMDFIPNHTSDLHPWFKESRKSRDNPYSDFYVWADGKVSNDGSRGPPNNWMSIFGGSMWQWDELREQYYLHQFIKEQPDLNYRNPKVVEEMKDVVRFWVERGVDGLRVDAIATLFEVEDLSLNEPRSHIPGYGPTEHMYYAHLYTLDQDDIHQVTRGWRDVMDELEAETGKHTYMVMEVYDESLVESMKYYHSGADMPFNFKLIFLNKTCGGSCVHALVDSWFQKMPEEGWPNFVIGNHDQLRVTTRKGVEYADALNIMLLTLPGTPTTYYGEEIGMLDIAVSYEETQDPWGLNMGPELYKKYSRDSCRSPMQWDGSPNAGFSTAESTWLPVHPNYLELNVQVQAQDPVGETSLSIYAMTARLRKQPAFRSSSISYHVVNDNVFSYTRSAGGSVYLITLNLGLGRSTDDYTTSVDGESYAMGVLMLSTANFEHDMFHVGATFAIDSISLDPGQALVLKLLKTPKRDEF